jgi:patatin-like phospholipase/acyl hydrolase
MAPMFAINAYHNRFFAANNIYLPLSPSVLKPQIPLNIIPIPFQRDSRHVLELLPFKRRAYTLNVSAQLYSPNSKLKSLNTICLHETLSDINESIILQSLQQLLTYLQWNLCLFID